MKLGVKLRPSRSQSEHDPGHMGVYWTGEEDMEFRGFGFQVDDLPDQYQHASLWREFLLNHTVPGYIFDDIVLRDDYERRPETLLRHAWPIDENAVPALVEETRPRQFGRYSFNPDRFGCHNCVTWTVNVINRFVGRVLQPVREGRVRLMRAQLESLT